ncbi:MAG TPA: response regulator [Bacillales bacterium]|nr:response regulator [Bacillales bacterium]
MIQAIIVDDEELSLISLEKKLLEFPDIKVVKTYTNHEHVLTDIKKEIIDVAFLDIELVNVSGLDLAEAILSIQPSIHIVFVTAHMEYAVQAFEINSADYLLKPVISKRLQKTIHRLMEKKSVTKTQETGIGSSANSPLTIKCFSELQVFQNEQLVHFKTAKMKELFGYFLTYLGTYIKRDILIDHLWPDEDYKKSKIHLHTCLSHLRKLLDELGYSNCITFANQSYSLTLEPIHCDVIEFEKSIQYLTASQKIDIQHIEKSIDLYTGTYMELNGYQWAQAKSQEYHQQMMFLLNKTIEYFQNIDDEKTLYYLQIQLKLNPYLEEKVKQTMKLLVKLGNRFKAIKMYKDYEQMLLHELAIKPEENLVQLYNSLLK